MCVRVRGSVSHLYCQAWERPRSVSRQTLPLAKSEPVSSRLAIIRSYASCGTTSSLSTKVRNSAVGDALRTPVLRAALSPALRWRT